MTLCQPASSQLNPTYIRTMNHTGASRVSENRSLARGGSATTVSLWTIEVDTLFLLSLMFYAVVGAAYTSRVPRYATVAMMNAKAIPGIRTKPSSDGPQFVIVAKTVLPVNV